MNFEQTLSGEIDEPFESLEKDQLDLHLSDLLDKPERS